MPDLTIVVPESQLAHYREAQPALSYVPIPDGVHGISRVRNWILGKFPERPLCMFDDDIHECVSLVGAHYKYMTREEVGDMIKATAWAAMESGARAFGWNQAWDVRKFQTNEPFDLCTWLGGALGVVDPKIRWDERLTCKCDIDFTLTELLENRYVWVDSRFSFKQKRNRNLGGSSEFRTKERIQAEMGYLKRKWGGHIQFAQFSQMEKTSISVQRKQV